MTTEHSKDFVQASLRLADRALEGAQFLLDKGEYSGAISRGYYAIFMQHAQSFTKKASLQRATAGLLAYSESM
jgi:uncharacterized protein (UPF0332 family)